LALELLAGDADAAFVESHEIFGANVRGHRKRLGMSQEALGFASGLHPTEVSRLERAVREPRLRTIVRIARALDVRPGDLLDGIS
jgi:transcriptional regulator with XRE-family HTH domain